VRPQPRPSESPKPSAASTGWFRNEEKERNDERKMNEEAKEGRSSRLKKEKEREATGCEGEKGGREEKLGRPKRKEEDQAVKGARPVKDRKIKEEKKNGRGKDQNATGPNSSQAHFPKLLSTPSKAQLQSPI
jgi:hypothetical protein